MRHLFTQVNYLKYEELKRMVKLKKLIALFAAFVMLMPQCNAAETPVETVIETEPAVTAELLPDTTVTEKIASGVKIIKTVKHTTDGIQKITMIEADISRNNLYLKPLFSVSGSNRLETVETLVSDNYAIGGINADFFSWGSESGTGSAIGYNKADGVLITTPCITEKVAAVGITKDEKFVFDYFERNISITTSEGKTAEIKHINKYDSLDGIVLYDRSWNRYSLGSHGNLVEIVVEDDTVKEIRYDMPPVEIPENGYVLAGLIDIIPFLANDISEGDEIELSLSISPSENCEHVIGGGTLLIKNGKYAPITHAVGGRQPRSAFAVDKSGNKVYLIAVDGRGDSIGMTLSELQEFLLDTGAYNAINFDGGGSTQLVLRDEAKWAAKIINNPSQTPYRKVINALGLMDAKFIRNNLADAYTEDFSGKNTSLYVYPRDTSAEYEITDSGEGLLTYDFTKEGDKLLSAGFSLSSPALISNKNSKISIDVYGNEDNKQWLRCMLTDANGDVQRIDLADEINWNGKKTISIKIPEKIALPAKLTRIYMVQPDLSVKSAGSVLFDNLTVTGQEAFNLAITAGVTYQETALSKITAVHVSDELSTYADSIVIPLEANGVKGNIDRKKSFVSEIAGVSIVQCDNPDTDLKEADGDVIVAISEKDPRTTGMAEKLDKKALEGKRVFVVYSADKTVINDYGKVVYIGLGGLTPSLKKNMKTCDILNLYKENGSVKYEIEKHNIW